MTKEGYSESVTEDYKVMAIVLWVLSGLFLLFLIFTCSRIQLAA